MIGGQILQNPKLQGNGTEEGQQIGNGLGDLDTGQTEYSGEDQHQGDEETTLTGNCQEGSRCNQSHGLHHHIAHNHPALEAEGHALEAQRSGTALDNGRIIPEQSNQIGGKDETDDADADQENQRNLNTEPETFPNPGIKTGTVIETAYRLESLAKAQHGGETKHGHTLDNAHCGDGSITERLRSMVQADGCDGGQTLTSQRGESTLQNHTEVEPLDLYIADMNVDITTFRATLQEQAEADELADDRRPAGAGHTQIQYKNKDRIQRNIDDSAGDNTDHSVACTALEPKLVVQHQRCSHPGCAEKDHPQIGLRVGENGWCGTEEVCQRLQKNLTQNADYQTSCQRGIEAGSCHIRCFLVVLLAKLSGNVDTTTLAVEESHGLNDGHHREDDTHSAGGCITVEHANEVSIGHIVECSDQHADDAGDCEFADQFAHRRLGHLTVFLFNCVHIHHLI